MSNTYKHKRMWKVFHSDIPTLEFIGERISKRYGNNRKGFAYVKVKERRAKKRTERQQIRENLKIEED